MFHLDLNSLNVPFDYGKLETKPHVANAKSLFTLQSQRHYYFGVFKCLCHKWILWYQMKVAMTFLRPKLPLLPHCEQVVSKTSCIDPVLLPSPCQQIKGDNMKHFIANGFLPEFLPPRLKQGFVQEHSHLTFKKKNVPKHFEQNSYSFILKRVM